LQNPPIIYTLPVLWQLEHWCAAGTMQYTVHTVREYYEWNYRN
jgi:hypothetical protein